MLLVLEPVHVLVMAVLCLTLWWIFRRVNGTYILSCFPSYSDLIRRQMNMDYSICNALTHNTNGLSEGLVEYDVACAWSINFSSRLQSSRFLSLPEGMNMIPAVGKFHLASHKGDCFAKFSLNFVHGAGQQDGEILETLWASLNKAAGSIRAMSKAHRQEVLDDHMRDSNWKKLVLIGMLRCSKSFA